MGKQYSTKFHKNLLLLVLLVFLGATAQDIQEINIGEYTGDNYLNKGEYRYFKVPIRSNKYDGSQDLIVKVFSDDQQSDPDVFISKTNQRPQNVTSSDWSSQSFGKDVCTVSNKNISRDDIFYIGVRCYSKCSFKLYTSLEREITLIDGQEMQVQFEKDSDRIFKFYIPPNAAKDEQNRITSVTIVAAPYLPGTRDLMLSATTVQGKIPNSSDRRGVSSWTKGSVLRISTLNTQDWCTDCNVTILVDVINEGRYQIKAKTNIGITKLSEGIKIDDVAYYGEQVCYKYLIESPDKDVFIRVTEFSGMTSISMNPLSIPKSYREAYYQSISSYSSNLIITAQERKANKTSTGLNYICVFGHLTSTYSIQVNEIDPNLPYRPLEDGFMETDEIFGQTVQAYLYLVPPLDYTDEKINVTFQLTTLTGSSPLMVAKYCEDSQNLRNCAKNRSKSEILRIDNTEYQKASIIGNHKLSISIDHKEKECKTKNNGECYYAILVIGTSNTTDEHAKFQITGTHTQQNHQPISEGEYLIDQVNLNSYRYFKFSLVDANHVKNVTIKMSTLHGDADLYLSRSDPHPTKYSYEKSSLRQTGMDDMIFYDKDDLSGAYFIAVYGYQYSTFNLIVKIERNDAQTQYYPNIPIISEGVSQTSTIHDVLLVENYRFEVKMKKGYEKTIRIIVQHQEGSVQTFVNVGKPATKGDYIWKTEGNTVEITPTDPNYKSEGIYFVGISPIFAISDVFNGLKWTYNIHYTTQSQFVYLQSKNAQQMSQPSHSLNYYRHFVSDTSSNIELVMTIFNGNPEFFVGINPDNKWPSDNKYDYDSRTTGQHIQGKTLVLTPQMLQSKNPSCTDTLTNEEPCALYISVKCSSECQYSLRLTYNNSAPHQLVIGQPQHDTVNSGAFKFYYVTIRYNRTSDVFAVLHSMSGNTDLYVNQYEPLNHQLDKKWKYPSLTDYSYKSTQAIGQDVIRIKNQDVQNCFSGTSGDKSNQECTFLYGVYGVPATNVSTPTPPNKFNLVVYTDMLQLYNNIPHTDHVEKGEFIYYVYKATCRNCTILIALSTFSNGDPDLYINVGDSKLPTRSDYNFKSSTMLAEVIEINLQHEYFKANNIKSMNGTYILGVFGSKNSTFVISVTQERNPMLQLQDGIPIKHSSLKYETAYYNFFNWQNKTLKISLAMSQGDADLYVQTFNESNKTQNLISRMPTSKRNTQWFLEDISTISSSSQRELIIKNADKFYCNQCLYIIGVGSHEKSASYQINIQQLDDNYNNTQLLKLGQHESSHVNKGEIKIFKFQVDDNSDINIQVTTQTYGQIKAYIGFTQNSSEAFQQFNHLSPVKISKNDINMRIHKMYYIIIQGVVDTNIQVHVYQEQTIMSLHNGVPITLRFEGHNDTKKFMMIRIPQGDSTIKLQVQSLTSGFNPKLYYKRFDNIQDQLKNIQLPPGGDFFSTKAWDYKLKVLKYTQQFKGEKGNAGLVIGIHDTEMHRQVNDINEVTITASYSTELIMLPEQTYIGNLYSDESFVIYKVDNKMLNQINHGLVIEFAGCRGDPEFSFVKSPTQLDQQLDNTRTRRIETKGRESAYFILPYPEPIYVMVKPKYYQGLLNKDSPQTTDFLIRSYIVDNIMGRRDYEIILATHSYLTYEFIEDNNFNLTWDAPFIVSKNYSFQSFDKIKVSYHIVVSADLNARLDTICALSKEIIQAYNYATFETSNTYMKFDQGVPGTRYLVNVIAQATLPNGEIEYTPMSPIEIYVPKSSTITKIAFWLYVVAAIVFSGAAVYYWRRAKVVEQQLEYEMQDVRNIARVGGGNNIGQIKQEKYQSLVKQDDRDDEQTSLDISRTQ